MVDILEDKILEGTESFTINLEKSRGLSNKFTVDPSVKTINITDNDCKLAWSRLFHSLHVYTCTYTLSVTAFAPVYTCHSFVIFYLLQLPWLGLHSVSTLWMRQMVD